MKTIVFADSHLRHNHLDTVRSWEEPVDKAVYLGDVFDQWSDTPAQNALAARWLKGKLDDPRNICLWGNHDLAYGFPLNRNASCSGFSHEKSRAIRQYLIQLDFEKLRLSHVENGILFSHAGLSADLLDELMERGYDVPVSPTAESLGAWLDALWPKILNALSVGQGHLLMGAGYDRGGSQRHGGLIWKDYSGLKPIRGIGQVVGHSIVTKGPLFRFINDDETPMWRVAGNGKVKSEWLARGWALDIDSNSKHYLIIEDGVMRVKSVTWQRNAGDLDFTVTPGETICQIDLSV